MRLKRNIIVLLLICVCPVIIPQLFHRNKGESVSIGDYNNGSMINGYLLPRKADNFHCYSWFSYYILGREYINSAVYNTVIDSYGELEQKYPGRKFIYMEAARRKGGRVYPHRTHQSGLSIDFMSPIKKKNGKPKYYNWMGIYRYTLNYNKDGISLLNSDVSIDFNLIAEHILILEKNARKHNLKIKKVIFNIDLKDNLYQTEYGKKLRKSGIYLVQNLTPLLNKLHDDHYHIDFEQFKK